MCSVQCSVQGGAAPDRSLTLTATTGDGATVGVSTFGRAESSTDYSERYQKGFTPAGQAKGREKMNSLKCGLAMKCIVDGEKEKRRTRVKE